MRSMLTQCSIFLLPQNVLCYNSKLHSMDSPFQFLICIEVYYSSFLIERIVVCSFMFQPGIVHIVCSFIQMTL
jgi:hypothetical protein